MSVTVMALAWYVGDITPAQKAVMLALADHADEDGNRVYPAVERLCLKTSYAERTVRRALADLREMGLIHIVQESTRYRPTEYRIDLPQMQAMQNTFVAGMPEMHPSTPAGVPENTAGVPENTVRDARNAPKPSVEPPIEPPIEPSNDPGARDEQPPELSQDEKETKALMERLHHVGSAANKHVVDVYMALAEEIGLENVLRGLTAAAEQGKQYSVAYVTTCARNAQRGESSSFRNGATNGTHRRNRGFGRDPAPRDPEPEFIADEKFLAQMERFNAIRNGRAPVPGS